MTGDKVDLHFAVSDTGIGISEDKKGLIFKAFTQADGSTTRRFGGTGLGLTISSQLAGMMNGRIWVESEANRGSVFHFTAQFEVKKVASEIPAILEAVALETISVLAVDDNSINRRVIKKTLTNWGMNPLVVDSGQSALEALDHAMKKNDKFDLVILDLNMPKTIRSTGSLRCVSLKKEGTAESSQKQRMPSKSWKAQSKSLFRR
jgi:hypothetical protein